MKSDDPFNMRPQWDALLGIYKEFAKICDRHGLRYWFAEGNAIGALRHEGFVPWDDDIDVIMPRPDYEKFVAAAAEELPPHLKYWNWRDVSDWRFTMGKVQETRADRVASVENAVGHVLSNGLYIDILVLDGFPEGRLAAFVYKLKIRLLGMICRFQRTKRKSYSRKGQLEWVLGGALSLFCPWYRGKTAAMEKLERVMKSIPFEGAKHTWRTGSSIRVTMTFPGETWRDTVWKDFEGMKVPLPIGYDSYLRTQYGDYMQLPPKEQQKPCHTFKEHFSWWLGPTNDRARDATS